MTIAAWITPAGLVVLLGLLMAERVPPAAGVVGTGDALLLVGDEDLPTRLRDRDDFVLVAPVVESGGTRDLRRTRASVGIVVAGTMLLTEPLSNAAAAALMLPIGLSVAGTLHGDPMVFAAAVAVAASASLLTPIGYQTNTMVYGLGGYRFGDYARLGAPLTALSLLVITTGVLLLAW